MTKSNTIGLDIGTTSIKIVSLARDKNVLSYDTTVSGITPEKGLQSDSPFDQEDLAGTIHQMILDGKIGSRMVHIAIAENQVYTKIIDMPLLSDKELSSAIYWEAEQYIPAPLNTITIDYKILSKDDKTKTEPRMQVLLVGAPILLIKKYQQILGLAGINIASIETEIISVVRCIVVGDNFPNSILVHIGAMSTSLAIIQKGIIVFTYSIPLGGTAINRAIATDFGFSMSQAEEYKKVYGMTDDKVGTKINNAIEPILQSIIGEVKKALAFYNDKYKNESPISQVLLSGGTARLPGIDIFFVSNTGIETAIVNPWKALNIQGVPQEILDTGPEYTIAVGLALKEYEK